MNPSVVIAFGSSPTSMQVIDAGVRFARSTGAAVVACSVRHRRSFGEAPADQLSVNARYANDRGAEVLHVEGRGVVDQLVKVARDRKAHTIVIGRSPGYVRWLPWREDIVRRINRVAGDISLLVVGATGNPRDMGAGKTSAVVPPIARDKSYRWIPVVIIMMTAVALSAVVDRISGRDAHTVMILLTGVLFSSTLGTRVSGLLSSVLAVLLFNFFFTEPRYTLVVDDPSYLITFPVMFVVAFVTSELTSRLNASVTLARTRQERSETLYRNSEQLLSARGIDMICSTVEANLRRLLQRDVEVNVDGNYGGHETESFRSPVGTIVDIAIDSKSFGTISVHDHERPLTVGSVALVNAIAAQLAIALDRERLTRAEEAARLNAERERVRANLLRSVSHDLRTPLAAIAGAAQVLRENDAIPETYRGLIVDIESDTVWLAGMVENILSLTRMNEETLALNVSDELIEDILLEAVERVSRRSGLDRFDLRFPGEIIMVSVDPSLVGQLFINVLGNAVDFSPEDSPVAVSVAMVDDLNVSIVVQDGGPGIPEEDIHKVFDLFYTKKIGVDSRRGLGVGLNVAKTVAELHGGSIKLSNAGTGGLIVTITLPAWTVQLPTENE